MAKVRIPVVGTVGKSVRINPDANVGGQIGVDISLPSGKIPTFKELAIALNAQLPLPPTTSATRGSMTPSNFIFESQIIDGDILARVDGAETITQPWTFTGDLTLANEIAINWLDDGGVSRELLVLQDGAEFDANFNDVALLMPYEGADGTTTTSDLSNSAHASTFVGNAQIETAQFNSGTSSLRLDGTGDWVTVPDSEDFTFGGGDFTIDVAARFAVIPGGSNSVFFMSHYDPGSSDRSWTLRYTNGIGLRFIYSTDGIDSNIVDHAWTPVADTWYQIRVSRIGPNIYVFIDGVLQGSPFNAGTDVIHNSVQPLTIGALGNAATPSLPWNGWLDDIRITKGLGRSSATFTLPTGAWPTGLGFAGFVMGNVNHLSAILGTELQVAPPTTFVSTAKFVDAVNMLVTLNVDGNATFGSDVLIEGPTNSGSALFAHNDTDFFTTFVNTTNWVIAGATIDIKEQPSGTKTITIDGGLTGSNTVPLIHWYDAGNLDRVLILISEDGGINETSGVTFKLNSLAGSPNNSFSFGTTGPTGDIFGFHESGFLQVLGGNTLRIQDSTNADHAEFGHNGVDFNTTFVNTGNWIITGITSIEAGTVDADFNALSATHLQFDLNFTNGTAEGRLQWNIEDGTLEVGMPGGNVNLQIGQETLIRCRNTTGVLIADGSPVYVTGASGNKPLIALADATNSATADVLGIVTENIANNANGFVTLSGLVRDVNTAGMTAGDKLWLSETAGAFTTTQPSSPAQKVRVGHVIAVSATMGTIHVALTPGKEFSDISDSGLDNDLLHRVANVWVPSAGALTFDGTDLVCGGDISGLTIGGIVQSNLLDRTANEIVTGRWDFESDGSAPQLCIVDSDSNGAATRAFIEYLGKGDVLTGRMGYLTAASGIFTIDNALPNAGIELTNAGVQKLRVDINGIFMSDDTDVAGALTAVSYGGIIEANLLDKTAGEIITGLFTFQNRIDLSLNLPRIRFSETDASTDNRIWEIMASSEQFVLRVQNDATSVFTNIMTVDRTGTVIDGVDIFAPLTATSFGGILAANLLDKSAAEEISGIYQHTTNVRMNNNVPIQARNSADTSWRNMIFLDSSDIFQIGGASRPVNVNGVLTAVSYGGVLEANLLDKTANETITKAWTFAQNPRIENADPRVWLNDTNVTADNGKWVLRAAGENFLLQAVNDAETVIGTALTIGRTGAVIDTFDVNATFTAGNVKRGTGSPEGVVTGIVGDMFQRTDGGAGSTLYIKESGTGNTGWAAK